MKTLSLCVILVGLLATQVNSSVTIDIPVPVTQAFAKKYSEVEDLSWHIQGGNFTANFYDEKDGFFKEATFEKTGNWLETKTDTDLDNIPEVALEYLETNFSDLEAINTITKIEMPNNVQYLVALEEDERPVTLLFDAKGNLIEE
jgi:hypothetical protein